MANYNIKIDLLKLQGAFVQALQGKTGIKRCLVIPIDECKGLFVGEKGCYLNMTAFALQEPKYNDTHCIKVSLSQEERKRLTEAERNAIPIIGGLHSFEPKQQIQQQVSEQPQMQTTSSTYDNDNLPF